MADAPKLQALTSLRFFAALAIVLHHIQGSLGVDAGFARPVLLEQGVSFFFVLSGFILTHVHGGLRREDRARFLWARFARVWPGHVAAIALVIVVWAWTGSGPIRSTLPAALANLGLLHAWFPWPSYYFSLNNVSWTLSVEAFFYASFPIVAIRIGRRWPFWLALSLAAGLAMTEIAARYPVEASSLDSPTIDSFVNINPLARWFEFVVGICSAVAWRRISAGLAPGRMSGTAIDCSALVVVALFAYYSAGIAGSLSQNPAQFLWLARGPVAAPAFALLIAVMASHRGAPSRLLAHPVLVRLGEISYALYLIHYPILKLAWTKFPDAASGPGLILLFVLLLSVSHLLWQCVEAPARRAMTRRFPMASSAPSAPLFPKAERKTLAACAALSALSLGILLTMQQIMGAG